MAQIRKILHFDLDAFYCAVEELRDPSLRGKAFAVGARPEERGVVASCSYAARAFGVHSAMPMSQAIRLCPKLIIVPRQHGAYEKASGQVMEHLYALTPLVERVSIDEAFLDMTGDKESAEGIALRLQDTIQSELGLSCSLGVATNKLVAKIANDVGKAEVQSNNSPHAVKVVPPGTEADFFAPLPIRSLWGVGPKTAERLASLGVRTIGHLARMTEEDLVRRFGKHGRELSYYAKGIDNDPIETVRETQSVSKETTFSKDVREFDVLDGTLLYLSEGIGRELRVEGLTCRTLSLKFRYPDFTTVTRQMTLSDATDLDYVIYENALRLFKQIWRSGQSVRLLGVSASKLNAGGEQLSLWDQGDHSKRKMQNTVDAIRGKFGNQSVRWGKETKRGDA
ncbi:MAG: DNA polymerase IV [Candidatus Latescibacteria bacterium]|mgnify:CR=1 FL=1|jgi:DNA polymerase IV|nr:DNA polymerase IV [Candidatus Latescibacterota bacterium]MBT4136544.1 DNA polymerase IV [Candidatus Latescibacterota bacterium]